MSKGTLVWRITHEILNSMYQNNGSLDEDGEKIYRKNTFILAAAIIILLIFIPCLFCNNYMVDELILENDIDEGIRTSFYLLCYAGEIFMILLAVYLITAYKKFRLSLSRERIICYGVFSKKTIEFSNLDKITYSNFTGLVFKGSNTKIRFGIYTNGLIEVLDFIEDNIPVYKFNDALKKARKMLKNNKIEYRKKWQR